MPPTHVDLELLTQWTGRTEQSADLIHAAPARALAATLDTRDDWRNGAALPPLWHWIYFWSAAPASQLGEDGHPLRGGFLPPVPLPRRMWAGGRLRFHAPLTLGAEAQRTSTIKDVQARQGKSGALVFVTVEHRIVSGEQLCITEEHDIVYREMPRAGVAAPVAVAPEEAQWSQQVTPDPTLLFRYSALTFNGHRIHYDRSYASGVEGYPGLVVHGPLVATMLMALVRRELPARTVSDFSFRASSPLFDIDPFSLNGRLSDDGRTVSLWAANAQGALAMQAEATLA